MRGGKATQGRALFLADLRRLQGHWAQQEGRHVIAEPDNGRPVVFVMAARPALPAFRSGWRRRSAETVPVALSPG
ncbi:hypothetical protein, partial [Methylocystis borbori]|uniref:hypothetical protein n=1 Tax=Methylocystis borbori TaxID=3118750 RepID=UPI0038CC1AC0